MYIPVQDLKDFSPEQEKPPMTALASLEPREKYRLPSPHPVTNKISGYILTKFSLINKIV